MGADISRVRFDSLNDFGGLVMQQGRLLLDADFNEFVAMLDRRLRAETSDLTSFGPDPNHAGVAWVPRLTPDGFRITVGPGVGDLTIGQGRMYVDGLLAENHGGEPSGFDPLLSEPTGTTNLTYLNQPYWPIPEDLPRSGRGLAYLDVWQREVTHLEDPDLVEIAVGVDSTARLQTVWQVRVLPTTAGFMCASPDSSIPEWEDIIRPSVGRLTTGTIAVNDEDDPCALPPTGGFRGRENQTYRVEIHEGGAPGTATFKWSRDNGSVAFPVLEVISSTELRLASLGRDSVLRISTGDWVEIVDDHREFNQTSGELRKVTVDEATRTVSFTSPLPADLIPDEINNPGETRARHFKVRRWDQAGSVQSGGGAALHNLDGPTSTGAIPIPSMAATQVVLENGVVVSFSVDGPGGFKPGDYWVFTARTEDTSVEELVEAPPLGTHHHYARLAQLNFDVGSATDCRRMWPPTYTGSGDHSCGDCTVCLTPELHNSGEFPIQAAVDSVAGTGGTICLAPGVYEIGNPVVIDDAGSVRIRGRGLRTLLVATGEALVVSGSWDVTIENMAIIGGRTTSGTVVFRNVVAGTLENTTVLSLGISDAVITRLAGGITPGTAVALSGLTVWTRIKGNVLVGGAGIATDPANDYGILALSLGIEDNVVGGITGIDLGGLSLYGSSTRISDNEVIAADGGAIVATGFSLPSGALTVDGNRILASGDGITVGSDSTVTDNTVTGIARQPGADGIAIESSGMFGEPGPVRVSGNRVDRRSGAAINLRTPVSSFVVSDNILTSVGAGIAVFRRGGAEVVNLVNNHITDVTETDQDLGATMAIAVSRSGTVNVRGNTIRRVGDIDGPSRLRAGVLTLACGAVSIEDNLVDEVAPLRDDVGAAGGILAFGPFNTATVSGNTVRVSATVADFGGAWGIHVPSWPEGHLGFGPERRILNLEGGTMVFTGGYAYMALAGTSHASVSDNFANGFGFRAACEVQVIGDVVADGNHFEHMTNSWAAALGGMTVIASSNRVRGPNAPAQLHILTNRSNFTAVGNITSGGVINSSAPVPAPWTDLNPIVP